MNSPVSDTLRHGTALRLAFLGSTSDRVRAMLTVVGSAAMAVTLLMAGAVTAIGPMNGPYRWEVLAQSGLHPGVILALLLLCVPLAVLVGNAARIGGPDRMRRLAAFRLAGATPGQVRRILVTEMACTAFIGSALGTLGYLIAHRAAGNGTGTNRSTAQSVSSDPNVEIIPPTAPNGRILPLDTTPHLGWWLAALLVVPIAAALGGLIALRRTAITPLAVSRRLVTRPPRVLPIVLLVLGMAPLLASTVSQWVFSAPAAVFIAVTLTCAVLITVALVLGSAAVAYTIGGLLAPRTSQPALLIAARRMRAEPFTASRTSSVVALAVLIGAMTQEIRSAFLADTAGSDDPFYRNAFDLVNVVLGIGIALAVLGLLVVWTENVVQRRRAMVTLQAAGVPARTLTRALLTEALVPLLMMIAIATAAGFLIAFGLYGAHTGDNADVAAPVPWAGLVTVAAGTFVLAGLMTAMSLVLLPSKIDVIELRTA